jgi:hypothetical protein
MVSARIYPINGSVDVAMVMVVRCGLESRRWWNFGHAIRGDANILD